MNVEEIRARLKAALGVVKALPTTWLNADGSSREPTDDELSAYEAKTAESERIKRQLDAALAAEAVAAASAAPVATPPLPGAAPVPAETRSAPAPTVPAAAARKFTASETLAAHALARAKTAYDLTKGVLTPAEKTLESIGLKSLSTTPDSNGGYLMETQTSRDFIEFLRPASAVLPYIKKILPMPGGSLDIPGGASGATAGYVGELASKPVSKPSFREVQLRAKKIAGIVVVSNELLERAIIDALPIVESDLRSAVTQEMDLAFLRGSGAGAYPKGFRSIALTDATTVTAPGGATHAQILSHLGKMELVHLNRHLSLTNAVWVMSHRTKIFLTDMLTAQGTLAFPSLSNPVPTLRGKPVSASSQVPSNLGSGTNESELYLVDFEHVLMGDTMSIRMDSSREATIRTGADAASDVRLWQQNGTAVLVEAAHDIGVRHVGAVALSEGVTWGA